MFAIERGNIELVSKQVGCWANLEHPNGYVLHLEWKRQWPTHSYIAKPVPCRPKRIHS